MKNSPLIRSEIIQALELDLLGPSLKYIKDLINIGNQESISIMNFTELLEKEIGIKVIKTFKEFQLCVVQPTSASTELLHNWTGLKPYKSIIKRIRYFIEFYKSYYPLN